MSQSTRKPMTDWDRERIAKQVRCAAKKINRSPDLPVSVNVGVEVQPQQIELKFTWRNVSSREENRAIQDKVLEFIRSDLLNKLIALLKEFWKDIRYQRAGRRVRRSYRYALSAA